MPLLSERITTNVRRFADGEPLIGPVDVDLGWATAGSHRLREAHADDQLAVDFCLAPSNLPGPSLNEVFMERVIPLSRRKGDIVVLAFYWLIDEASRYAAQAVDLIATGSHSLFLGNLAVMALGLVLVRLIVRYATGDSPGENIPDVMHAVARRGGVLHATPVLAKTATASAQ